MCKLTVGLCAGRHPMPVEEYIFPEPISTFDTDAINQYAANWVDEHCDISLTWGIGLNQADDYDVQIYYGGFELVLYVTGLTVATAAVIRACALYGVPLTLMHYNPQSGEYYPQKIF